MAAFQNELSALVNGSTVGAGLPPSSPQPTSGDDLQAQLRVLCRADVQAADRRCRQVVHPSRYEDGRTPACGTHAAYFRDGKDWNDARPSDWAGVCFVCARTDVDKAFQQPATRLYRCGDCLRAVCFAHEDSLPWIKRIKEEEDFENEEDLAVAVQNNDVFRHPKFPAFSSVVCGVCDPDDADIDARFSQLVTDKEELQRIAVNFQVQMNIAAETRARSIEQSRMSRMQEQEQARRSLIESLELSRVDHAAQPDDGDSGPPSRTDIPLAQYPGAIHLPAMPPAGTKAWEEIMRTVKAAAGHRAGPEFDLAAPQHLQAPMGSAARPIVIPDHQVLEQRGGGIMPARQQQPQQQQPFIPRVSSAVQPPIAPSTTTAVCNACALQGLPEKFRHPPRHSCVTCPKVFCDAHREDFMDLTGAGRRCLFCINNDATSTAPPPFHLPPPGSKMSSPAMASVLTRQGMDPFAAQQAAASFIVQPEPGCYLDDGHLGLPDIGFDRSKEVRARRYKIYGDDGEVFSKADLAKMAKKTGLTVEGGVGVMQDSVAIAEDFVPNRDSLQLFLYHQMVRHRRHNSEACRLLAYRAEGFVTSIMIHGRDGIAWEATWKAMIKQIKSWTQDHGDSLMTTNWHGISPLIVSNEMIRWNNRGNGGAGFPGVQQPATIAETFCFTCKAPGVTKATCVTPACVTARTKREAAAAKKKAAAAAATTAGNV